MIPNQHKYLIISGPCSIESHIQILNTAKALKKIGMVHILRAGVWKARTRLSVFEGIGDKGLLWLAEAKVETGLPIMIEVLSPKHVEQALAIGVDYLWIGARTTCNPHSVKEIAESLRGSETPVFIKNPLNPDINLWIGAVERFRYTNVKHIGLIHRGFSTYQSVNFRNPPIWVLAKSMRDEFPNIPIICDPSHICGSKESIPKIMRHAAKLKYSGFMVEAHIDPFSALTDKKQQVSPSELKILLDHIYTISQDKKVNNKF
ncbi:MAG: hypothetical protein QM528_07980 [Phycisphaerales bacterium]|nr:hypothetical protein [Phycisphaerales bacterium]